MDHAHPATSPVPLGDFDLLRSIGRGATGQVWLALHRAQQLPVAIKIITSQPSPDRDFLRSFTNEVRSAARLEHPGIIAVHDHGQLPQETADATAGALYAGTPYLVMELADRGSLRPLCGKLSWGEVRVVLLHLLDALAHAHARGVVHRDIKTTNVLLCSASRSVKLTDFGIAHAHGSTDGVDGVLGTPSYMAPEQFRADWRSYGPWTDLYALGCLGWALITGAPPYGRRGELADFARAHTRSRPPPLSPQQPVPPQVEPWLRRLLARDPADRFQRAADAAWELLQLDPSGRGAADAPPQRVPSALLAWARDPEPGPPAPPPPRDWRRAGARVEPGFLGLGLGLFGLRTPPLVGRERERDLLWRALLDVRREGRARAVVLRGAAGSGKSSLARWLGERAHEVGAAEIIEVRHDPGAGPGQGVAWALARHLNLTGLGREERGERLDAVLSPGGALPRDERDALVALLGVEDDDEGEGKVRFGSPAERHALTLRLLDRLRRDRTLLLWLDDAQWGMDAIGLVVRLLTDSASWDAPILGVLTVQSEALAERRGQAELLRQLGALERCTAVQVDPLAPRHRRDLVQGLLRLEDRLAAQVEERSAGNPLYVVQLVGDWVERGLLEPGPEGYRLREAHTLSLPDSVQQLWTDRIEQILAPLPEQAKLALELAATLGLEVNLDEWHELCAMAGVSPGDELLERLLERRLAHTNEGQGSWSFAHAMITEAVAARAARLGRETRHHGLCADLLARRGDSGVRRGRHLLAAGRLDEASEALLGGAQRRLSTGDFRAALALLERYESTVQRLAPPASDARWGRGQALWTRTAQLQGRLSDAERRGRETLAEARRWGWRGVEASVRLQLGLVAREQGELATAWRHLRKCEKLATELRDRHLLPEALAGQCQVLISRGRHDEAAGTATRALELYQEVGRHNGSGRACLLLAEAASLRGDSATATEHLNDAHRWFERGGSRAGVAATLNFLGDETRLAGDWTRAERCYRGALRRYRAVGSRRALIPQLNLGLLLVQMGRYAGARALIEGVLAQAETSGARRIKCCALVGLLPCAAGEADWDAWDLALDAALELVDDTGLVEVDNAQMARLGGELASSAGEDERAAAAFGLSESQWRALERPAEADAVAKLRGRA